MAVMAIFSTDLSKPVNVRVYAEGAEAEKALQLIRKYAEECTGVIHDAKPVMRDIPEIRRSGKMATDGI